MTWKTCTFCAGSGNDPVTPSERRCMVCGGSGMVLDDAKPSGTGLYAAKGRSDRSGEGCLMVIVAGLVLGSIAFAGIGYAYSSEMVFHYWLGTPYRTHDWLQFAVYTALGLGVLALVAWYWGLIVGYLIGLIPISPIFHSFKVENGFYYIVTNTGTSSARETETWRLLALLSVLALHAVIAWSVARNGHARTHGWLWWTRSRPGLIATGVLGVAAIISGSLIAVALANF